MTKEDIKYNQEVVELLNKARRKKSDSVFEGHPDKEWLTMVYNTDKNEKGHYVIGSPYSDNYGHVLFVFD